MTMTYSEARQRVYFEASRKLRAIAGEVLDDVREHTELTSRNVEWAKSLARTTAEQANVLEGKGHEQCIASVRQENLLYKAREAYNASIDAFEKRVAEAKAADAILEASAFKGGGTWVSNDGTAKQG